MTISIEKLVDTSRLHQAAIDLSNALGTDADAETLIDASRAALRLEDRAAALAADLRQRANNAAALTQAVVDGTGR
jgi:hypothetical protein